MVDYTGLENQRTETFRGFESHPLRHARLAQLVERGLYTADVGSSSLSSRTKLLASLAHPVEQLISNQ